PPTGNPGVRPPGGTGRGRGLLAHPLADVSPEERVPGVAADAEVVAVLPGPAVVVAGDGVEGGRPAGRVLGPPAPLEHLPVFPEPGEDGRDRRVSRDPGNEITVLLNRDGQQPLPPAAHPGDSGVVGPVS